MSIADLSHIITSARPVSRAGDPAHAAAIRAAVADVEAADRLLRDGGMSGWRTGYPRLDDLTGGIAHEGILVIAGWSSCGKTSLAVPILVAMIDDGCRIIVFSADMPNAEFLRRFARARHGLSGRAYRAEPMSDIEREALHETAEWLISKCCILAPEQAWTVSDVIAFAEERAGQFDAILVDTMQSLAPEGDASQYERLNEAMAKFKAFKKRHRCAVMLSWQCKEPPSRFETARTKKDGKPIPPAPPTLNELEGTRRATQEAATVILVWRADYGRVDEDDKEPSVNAKIIVAKSQQGVTGSLKVIWDRDGARFVDLLDEGQEAARCLQNVSYSG